MVKAGAKERGAIACQRGHYKGLRRANEGGLVGAILREGTAIVIILIIAMVANYRYDSDKINRSDGLTYLVSIRYNDSIGRKKRDDL